MPATIIYKSPGGVDDKRARLANGQFARPFDIGSWDRIRFGFRAAAMDDLLLLTGIANWFWGFCSGTTNLPGDQTCTHAIGVSTGNVSWSYPGNNTFANTQPWMASLIGTTWTTSLGGSVLTAMGLGRTLDTQRGLYFLDLERGSPNWTAYTFYRNSSTSTSADISRDTFLSMMEIEAPSLTLHSSDSKAFPVDEGTNGALNAVFITWPRTTPQLEISDIAIARF